MKILKNKRLWITISAIIIIIGIIIGVMYGLGLNTLDKIQQAIANMGFWSYLIYFALTFLFMLGQFLPTALIVIAGVYAFGLWQGIIIGIVAVVLGANILFLLGKKFGTKIVKWVAGNEDISKWQEKITNGKYTIFLMLLLPISPDSLLYCLMGTSKINFLTFTIMIILSKPIGVLCTALLGGGAIIPISWDWAWLWSILGLLMALGMWASFKYQAQIDKFFNKFKKKDKQ